MAITLPQLIADYFDADGEGDAEAVARCFTEDAVVRDEGLIHAGRSAIATWKAESAAKYTYTAAPFAVATEGERTIVTSRLTGDFPGSPVDLRYLFLLRQTGIARLEISA